MNQKIARREQTDIEQTDIDEQIDIEQNGIEQKDMEQNDFEEKDIQQNDIAQRDTASGATHETQRQEKQRHETQRRRSFRGGVAALLALFALAFVPAAARAAFDSTPVTVAQVGVEYVYDVHATGTGNVTITAPYGLPPWLTLEPTGNGSARLHGTPQAGDSGQGVVLLAQDSLCSVILVYCYQYQTFDITIVQDAPPVVVAPGVADQTAAEGQPFALDVAPSFTDPDGDALSFTATGLPATFTMSASGAISGTPRRQDAGASPYRVTITADDGRGGRVSDEFLLTISALDRADLVLASIAADPAPALVNQPVTVTVAVRNDGPQGVNAAELSIELTGNALQLDASGCTVSAEEAGQRALCTLGPIAVGQSATATLTGTAAQAGDVFLRAKAAVQGGAPIDPAAANDAAAYSLNVGSALAGEPAQSIEGQAAVPAAGDLDGDGFDDAAVSMGDGSPVQVRLNVENPALNAALATAGATRRGLADVPLSLDAAVGPSIALADLDGDGDLDLLTAGAGPMPNAVYMNAGAGALTAGTPIGADKDDARAVAAGDLDGDGLVDAVFANAGADKVYMNRGATGFVAGPPLDAAALDSRDVVAVDVDGDARADLVFASANGPALLYRNTSGGFVRAADIDPGPTGSVASADFNADGFADLVFGRASAPPEEPPSSRVYLNDGKGGFVAGPQLGASPTTDVLAADFNADGLLDVAAINTTGAHEIFIGDGQGGFTPQGTLFLSPDAAAAATAHISRPGSADVVVAGKQGLDVFFNDGRGNLGLGDTSPPVISLVGEGEITVEVDSAYVDPGAVATDDVDGAVTPTIENPVDTQVIGTYTVKYTAVDSAGNPATPVTRTVHVNAKPASGGGGGGGVGLGSLALLLLALAARARAAARWSGRRGAHNPRAIHFRLGPH